MTQKAHFNPNHIFGILLILIGVVFLLNQFFDINIFDFAWPFFIILPGLAAYIAALALPEEPGRGLSAAGSIAITVGLILLYQNTFDHFESWAYAWALVAPTSIGVGWIGYGLIRRKPKTTREGVRIAGVGLLIFIVAAAFFELIIGISGFNTPFAGALWPILLIILGLILLARNFFGR